MTKKNIKVKPKFIVDLTRKDTMCPEQIADAFTRAKIDAGLPITMDEYNAAITSTVALTFEKIKLVETTTRFLIPVSLFKNTKKKPWYKRMWNWITGK